MPTRFAGLSSIYIDVVDLVGAEDDAPGGADDANKVSSSGLGRLVLNPKPKPLTPNP